MPNIILNIKSISKFCKYLGCCKFSSDSLSHGGLLQLWIHEWKKIFIDPVPNCLFQERSCNLMLKQLDTTDIEKWNVSNSWLQKLALSVGNRLALWTALPNRNDDDDDDHAVEEDTCSCCEYFPVQPSSYSLEVITREAVIEFNMNDYTITQTQNTNTTPTHSASNSTIVPEITLDPAELPTLLTSSSMAKLLTLIRILTLSSKSHIYLPHYFGVNLLPVIKLAGTTH